MVYTENRILGLGLLALSACVDLSTTGKTFACPEGPCSTNPASPPCSCDAVPAQCDGTVLVSTASPACLSDGGCLYQRSETQCPTTCTGAACDGEQCLGIVCDVPPRAECLDAQSLRGYTAQGTCQDGLCAYAHVDVSCTCESGHCLDNLCVGVNCNVPPAPSCVGNAARQYQPSGICDGTSGQCAYSYVDTTCTNGCAAGMCQPLTCSAATCPSGCCSGATCIGPVGQSAGLCGSAGVACGSCSGSQTCTAGQCGACQSESDADLCAAAGRACGPLTVVDRCGTNRTPDCGGCTANAQCSSAGQCVACTAESDPAFCSRLGKNCGSVTADDNCGAPRSLSCGSCSGPLICGSSNVCGCVAETDPAFCSRLGKACGTVEGNDNCGSARSASCGMCTSPQTCTASNSCACTAESNATFCARLGRTCGQFSAVDNCGTSRSANCGTCVQPQSCGVTNVCSCTPESDVAFCSRLGDSCGTVSNVDNCGAARSVSCGSCTLPATCSASNQCSCTAESDASFCSRLGKNCNTVSGYDNCGTSRSTSCGSCTQPDTCGGGGTSNVCGQISTPGRLFFSSSWQTLPDTGSDTLEFKCVGTVSGGSTSTRCDGADGVSIRINGTVYVLYPGCDDNRNNCVDTTPADATYADDNVGAGGRLLCAAMGWTLADSDSDENPGTTDRNVTVVQTEPTIYGTGVYKNYLSYVDCEP